jgi:TonB family protein
MRKTTFVPALSFCISLFCLVAAALFCLTALAQDATQTAVPARETPAVTVPKDPKALMLLAAKTNGLTGDDVKPWHLKASWKMLDDKGGIKDQGTYEEFWVSPTKYKWILTGSAFVQTEYGIKNDILWTGQIYGLPNLVAEIGTQFVSPMMSSQTDEHVSSDLQQRTFGDSILACLSMRDVGGSTYGPIWCLDSDKPILQVVVLPQGVRVVRNSIFSFESSFIARDLQFIYQGNLVLSAHLDSIEKITTIDESLFLAPPEAISLKPKIVDNSAAGNSPAVEVGSLIKMVAPDYPLYAKENGICGTVILEGVIKKDGHVADLHVISGPRIFQQSALDAVKEWVYKPYRLYGKPIEVQTTFNVIFTLDKCD